MYEFKFSVVIMITEKKLERFAVVRWPDVAPVRALSTVLLRKRFYHSPIQESGRHLLNTRRRPRFTCFHQVRPVCQTSLTSNQPTPPPIPSFILAMPVNYSVVCDTITILTG